MRSVVMESSKKVRNPNPAEVASGRPTVYDTWKFCFPDPAHPGFPRCIIKEKNRTEMAECLFDFSIPTLSSASDYASFMHVYGIPSVDFSYGFKEVSISRI